MTYLALYTMKCILYLSKWRNLARKAGCGTKISFFFFQEADLADQWNENVSHTSLLFLLSLRFLLGFYVYFSE